jgi:hypothetical protein
MPSYIIGQVSKPVSVFRDMKWADWLAWVTISLTNPRSRAWVPRILWVWDGNQGLTGGTVRRILGGYSQESLQADERNMDQTPGNLKHLIAFNTCVTLKEVTLSLPPTQATSAFKLNYLKVLNCNTSFLSTGFYICSAFPSPLPRFHLACQKDKDKENSGHNCHSHKSIEILFCSPC